MLTRTAVAKRIRRSVATVRRLEGIELFPRCDLDGVHRFNEFEVMALANRLQRGEVPAARGVWLDRGKRGQRSSQRGNIVAGERRKCREDKSPTTENELQRLRQENGELRALLALAIEQLDSFN